MDLTAGAELAKGQGQRLQQLAGDFEKAWKTAKTTADAPVLDAFLPPPEDSLREDARLLLIQIDLAMRWQRGQRICLEEYLDRFPELRKAPKQVTRLLYAEYGIRHQYGDKPHESVYQVRFPDQFDEVLRLIEEQKYKTVVAPTDSVPSASVTAAAVMSSAVAPIGQDGVLQVGAGYRLLKRIGSGSFGEVWRAIAPGGIPVAIKIIFRPIDHEFAQRELQSLELIKSLSHPYLVQTQAYWPLEDRLVIVMDLADASLSSRLKECRDAGETGIPPKELLGYFREAAEALDYLHSEKVQHRDIKPDNILLLRRHAKVADFGLARLQESIRIVNATACGTPAYMAPEVWKGKISPNSDQYSLAMTYIELRLGRPPFPGTDMVTMMEGHLRQQPDLAPLDEAEQQVILKAVSKDADQRYGSCREFTDALSQALAAVTGDTLTDVRATLTSLDPRLQQSPMRTWIGRGLWLLVACGLGLGIAVGAYRWNAPMPNSTTSDSIIQAAPVVLPTGVQKLGEETVEDLNGRKFYQHIVCSLPGDTEPIEFVAIPKGRKDDPDTFYMMVNKVSVGLYRKFAQAYTDVPSCKKWLEKNQGKDEKLPAFEMEVEDAHRFAEELRGRLPSVQEWDKAAGRYDPGDREGPYKGTWKTKPKIAVNLAQPMKIGEATDDESPFGCRDMAGNGQEWTRNCIGDGIVPLPSKDQDVLLRGHSYTDDEPWGYKGRAPESGSWKYRETSPEISFRVVIEP